MEVQREYIRQKEGSSTEINQIIGRPPGRDKDVHTLQTGRRNLKLALNSRHKTFCCVFYSLQLMKKAGNWYSYLSGSQSTLKIHVADMKTPLLKVANHIEVCHVAFVKQFFIFISIYTKMRTGSQNPSDIPFLRLLFTCGIHNFSHLYKTAVLRERQGQVYWRSLLEAKDFSWRGERRS